jgi:hypothetical protein
MLVLPYQYNYLDLLHTSPSNSLSDQLSAYILYPVVDALLILSQFG